MLFQQQSWSLPLHCDMISSVNMREEKRETYSGGYRSKGEDCESGADERGELHGRVRDC